MKIFQQNYFAKTILMSALLVFIATHLGAQTVSGSWTSAKTTIIDGHNVPGYNNLGNGVIQLTDNVAQNGGADDEGAQVYQNAAPYIYNTGTGGTAAKFTQCYKVFFGCPTNSDNNNVSPPPYDIGGDGMAFSFTPSSCVGQQFSGGGGLGYASISGTVCKPMFSIEFDTYSSAGSNIPTVDKYFGGGTTGNHDEISLHIDGDATDNGLLGITPATNVDAGQLEDGVEHTVCITYDPTVSGIATLTVTLDGVTLVNYNLASVGKSFQAYYGTNVNLVPMWSAGKQGATNYQIVADVTTPNIIATQFAATNGGANICPAIVTVAATTSCGGVTTISSNVVPPAGTTVDHVEFFDGATSLGTDYSAPYSLATTLTVAAHSLTAKAFYSNGTNSTSSVLTYTPGSTNQLLTTSTAPTIDGTADAVWASYTSNNLTKVGNGTTDNSASYKIMYDASNLYILVNVTDNNLNPYPGSGFNYNYDAVELFFDVGDQNKTSYTGNIGGQYIINLGSLGANQNTVITTYSGANSTGMSAKTTTGAGNKNYVMEVSIPLSSLGMTGANAPTNGQSLGFDLTVDDDDNGSTRGGSLGWYDGTFQQFSNPSLLGTLSISSCNPLPITLLSFTGILRNGTVDLNWATSMERNNKKFVIERMSGQSDWEAIGEVSAVGNSTAINNYSFTDYRPLEGISYYRLLQVDYDGKTAASNVVAIQTGTQSITISPNPFDNVLSIVSNTKEEMGISICDVLGRVVYQISKNNESGIVTIQPELVPGTYIITVKTDTFVEQRKIVRK